MFIAYLAERPVGAIAPAPSGLRVRDRICPGRCTGVRAGAPSGLDR
jgi:hypothetical protein